MKEDDFVFFWGGEFSQWYKAPMTIDGVKYNCCEQYMMAEKARLFGDRNGELLIMQTRDPSKQKAYGRNVLGFDKDRWEAVARDIVYKANYAKFTQHQDLKKFLLSTGSKVIVEASPYDTIWGIGLAYPDPRCLDPKQWLGTNWLGEAIMKARDTIALEVTE